MLGQVKKVSVAGDENDSIDNNARPLLESDIRERTDELLLAAAEVDYQEELIRQRGEGISNIHRDVTQIHGLFQDMSLHVSQQGQMLDNIEANLTVASDRTRNANEQLTTAARRIPNARQNCMRALLLVILLLFMVLMFRALLVPPNFVEYLSSSAQVFVLLKPIMALQI